MSVRLVLLGLLRDRPLYGYEIKRLIEQYMSDWTSIAFGSIYFALDKLAEEQLVEKIAVEHEGKRPARSVYQITDLGHEEFLHLLREAWRTFDRQYYDLDICLFFLPALPRPEVLVYLRERRDMLARAVDYIQSHRREQFNDPHIPPLAAAIFDHGQVHAQAELSWTTGLLQKLEAGEYN